MVIGRFQTATAMLDTGSMACSMSRTMSISEKSQTVYVRRILIAAGVLDWNSAGFGCHLGCMWWS